jgi:hypothetical protein
MVEIGIGDFSEYEKAWRDFLHRIERVWVKTQATVHGMSGWQKLESEIGRIRKTDELLRYLQHARNADEHSISQLANDWQPNLKAINIDGKVQLSWEVWDRPLLPVSNRGAIIPPPKSHLGKSIEHLKSQGKAEPRIVAELALRFYINFLNRVVEEVLNPPTR